MAPIGEILRTSKVWSDKARFDNIETSQVATILYRKTVGFVRLSPPALSLRQMGLHNVRVQLDAKARLLRYLDKSVLNVRTLVYEDLIHPSAYARDCLAC